MFVLQVLSYSRKSPNEDKGEEATDDTGVVRAHSTGRMRCATCIALHSLFEGKKRHIGDHAKATRSGHISGG